MRGRRTTPRRETPPHFSLASMLARPNSLPFPFRTPAMKAPLYLNLLVHQNLKVHFFSVRETTTRLRCETYSCCRLPFLLDHWQPSWCSWLALDVTWPIIIAKFDELVTVCRQNMQEIITLFFWQVLMISSPSCSEWSPLVFLWKN